MTRRTLLVPLFAVAFILAPSPLSGQSDSTQQTAVSAASSEVRLKL